MITAVVVEGRSPSEVARTYGVARSWVYVLVDRYRAEGDAAFEPRSRRPRSRPDATPTATVELIVELRKRLAAQGLDAGADTIAWHLQHHHDITVSTATIYRIIRRAGLVTAEPNKKPRSSYIRFAAEQPNETWQADFTHHRLADGTDIEIVSGNGGLADKISVMYAGRIVESGATDAVLTAPGHPYTQGLLGSIPGHGRRGERLTQIPGMAPNMTRLPEGCAFAPRCPRASDTCRA